MHGGALQPDHTHADVGAEQPLPLLSTPAFIFHTLLLLLLPPFLLFAPFFFFFPHLTCSLLPSLCEEKATTLRFISGPLQKLGAARISAGDA